MYVFIKFVMILKVIIWNINKINISLIMIQNMYIINGKFNIKAST
jgi:hypothetical protein